MTILTLPTAARPAHRDLDAAGEPSVMDLARKMQDRVAYRRILREELLLQPDSVLADAGISRPAAEEEAQKPFWQVWRPHPSGRDGYTRPDPVSRRWHPRLRI